MLQTFGKTLNTLFYNYLSKRMVEIDHFLNHPITTQKNTLLTLLKTASKTDYGLRFGFETIYSIDDFKKNVPLNRYEDLKPFIHKMQLGQKNILWPNQVKWYAQSSGTNSIVPKQIPISKENLQQCHYKGGKDLLALYYKENPNTKLFTGKHLIAGGSTALLPSSKKTQIGDLSAIILKHLPWWCEWRRSPSNVKKLITDDWKQKIDHIVNHSVKDDVHIVAGIPSWIVLILQEITEKNKLSNVHEIWPNLELYLHGGVHISPYMEKLKELMPSAKMNFFSNYNATEGFFGIQDKNNADDMLLMLDYGIFYEFIKKENWNDLNPKTENLENIKIGEVYELVISTNSGLWRYRLGDTIKFTNLCPFRFKVIGRTQQYINSFGEELMMQQVELAIGIAAKKANAQICEFSVCSRVIPTKKNMGYHNWAIEFYKTPENMSFFIEQLDIELQRVNIDYKAKRKNNTTISLPRINLVKKDTFYSWMKKHGKLGGQYKIPRLSEKTIYIDELLEISSNN
jgi:hypothetical protein